MLGAVKNQGVFTLLPNSPTTLFDALAQVELGQNSGDFRLLDRRALDALLAMLEPYGVCELVRTGRVALARGAGSITDRSLAAVPASAS